MAIVFLGRTKIMKRTHPRKIIIRFDRRKTEKKKTAFLRSSQSKLYGKCDFTSLNPLQELSLLQLPW